MSRILKALRQSTEPDLLINLIEEETDVSPPAEAVSATTRIASPKTLAPRAISPKSLFREVQPHLREGTPVFPFDGTNARAAEEYRMLRTHLLQHPLQPKVVAVSSAMPGDGKTITALNLAAAMALRSEYNVLLVDADLRRSAIAEMLGIDADPGLGNVLRGECRLTDAIVQIREIPQLCVLPAGQVLLNPAELLDSAICRSTFAELETRFGYIIVDTTPVSAVADFKLVQQLCDSFLLVVRPDHTNRRVFTKVLEIESRNKFLGVIVNAYEDWLFWRGQNYHQYYEAGTAKKLLIRDGA